MLSSWHDCMNPWCWSASFDINHQIKFACFWNSHVETWAIREPVTLCIWYWRLHVSILHYKLGSYEDFLEWHGPTIIVIIKLFYAFILPWHNYIYCTGSPITQWHDITYMSMVLHMYTCALQGKTEADCSHLHILGKIDAWFFCQILYKPLPT